MEEVEDITALKSPANFVICGATGSGKTTLSKKLISYFFNTEKVANFVVFYNVWQDFYEKFLQDFPTVKFIQGLSQKDIENPDTWKCDSDQVNICVCDDLADDALKNETFARLFTCYGHHWRIINIFITQNMFSKGPLSTTINRNAHYYILTRTPHLNVLDTLNAQLYGIKGPIKTAYLKAMELSSFSYLLIDVFCTDIRNRLRTNIFQDEGFLIIWRPINI